jgi:hypothetical protein
MNTLLLSAATALATDGEDLLDRCIAYHDPAGTWMQSSVQLSVEGSYADGRRSVRNCVVDNRTGDFSISVERDGVVAEQGLDGDQHWARVDGRTEITDEERESFNLNSERAKMMRDYMGYLWGLPMKLRDPGTNVDPAVGSATFQGVEVLDLKITYDADVGGDIWHIYIDPDDARMVGYAFFKDTEETQGEYITLEGEVLVGDAKIPKARSWYHVAGDEFLGTDTLIAGERR